MRARHRQRGRLATIRLDARLPAHSMAARSEWNRRRNRSRCRRSQAPAKHTPTGLTDTSHKYQSLNDILVLKELTGIASVRCHVKSPYGFSHVAGGHSLITHSLRSGRGARLFMAVSEWDSDNRGLRVTKLSPGEVPHTHVPDACTSVLSTGCQPGPPSTPPESVPRVVSSA